MANILFFCNYQVSQPACGGIVRVTGTLADIMSRHGHNCHLCYYFGNSGEPIGTFGERLLLKQHDEENDLARLIEEKKIDVIILQVPLNNSNWYLLPMLRKLADNAPGRCLLIHCFHTLPFAECRGYDLPYFRYMLLQKDLFSHKVKNLVWAAFCMLFPRTATAKTSPRYKRICDYCDYMILLSKRYIPFFTNHVDCRKEQVKGILNPLTFSSALTSREIGSKTKTVVIVGRLDESTKRLSKAIRIWSAIENRYKIKDWSLVFVGDGEDMDYYKRLAVRYKTENITFAGRQDTVEYYRKASILMCTSAIEGLPMVIIEAKQMGCIPVSFNSFDSVYDLIEDSYNGYIVRYNDLDGYAARLSYLMTHDDVRTQMIEHCLQSNDAYLPDNIYRDWQEIIE